MGGLASLWIVLEKHVFIPLKKREQCFVAPSIIIFIAYLIANSLKHQCVHTEIVDGTGSW